MKEDVLRYIKAQNLKKDWNWKQHRTTWDELVKSLVEVLGGGSGKVYLLCQLMRLHSDK